MGKYFGTDGVRGIANTELSCELAIDIGRAAAAVLAKSSEKPKLLIGKDTRVSSDMLENALAAGLCSVGADVVLLGFVPTPAVAYLVREYKADAGIVISASHNPVEYNGIKIFDKNGFKLADELEDEIEALMDDKSQISLKTGGEIGAVSFCRTAADDYVDYVCSCIDGDLAGVSVAVDCANGAAYETAKKIFKKLGANAVFTGAAPDGRNINDGVGSTHIENVRALLLETGADIGIAFDGDADRCLAVDENGRDVDGDKIIGVLAKHQKNAGKLERDTVVVTVMTNIGFMEYCAENGIRAVRTAVGDRYVLEEMRKEGYTLGGEQSGHVIQLGCSTTGDGQLTAVVLLDILKRSKKKLSELIAEIKQYPQLLVNVRTDAAGMETYKNDADIAALIEEEQRKFGKDGRVLVRLSGTEPLIRIMVEGKDDDTVAASAALIEEKILEKIR